MGDGSRIMSMQIEKKKTKKTCLHRQSCTHNTHCARMYFYNVCIVLHTSHVDEIMLIKQH